MEKQIYEVLKTFYWKTYKKWNCKMDFEKKTRKQRKKLSCKNRSWKKKHEKRNKNEVIKKLWKNI